MGGRVSITFTVGGELPRALVREFLDAIAADGLGLDWGNGGDIDAMHLESFGGNVGAALVLTGHQINYGNADELESFCVAKALPYRIQWDAGCEFGPGGRVWDGAEPEAREYPTTGCDGAPCITAAEVLDAHPHALETLANSIAKPIPPLVLTGEPATDDKEA